MTSKALQAACIAYRRNAQRDRLTTVATITKTPIAKSPKSEMNPTTSPIAKSEEGGTPQSQTGGRGSAEPGAGSSSGRQLTDNQRAVERKLCCVNGLALSSDT